MASPTSLQTAGSSRAQAAGKHGWQQTIEFLRRVQSMAGSIEQVGRIAERIFAEMHTCGQSSARCCHLGLAREALQELVVEFREIERLALENHRRSGGRIPVPPGLCSDTLVGEILRYLNHPFPLRRLAQRGDFNPVPEEEPLDSLRNGVERAAKRLSLVDSLADSILDDLCRDTAGAVGSAYARKDKTDSQ